MSPYHFHRLFKAETGLTPKAYAIVFQQRAWQALREIPPGITASYAGIAERIGAPKAVRAVAQTCGANHIAVAIPCRRIVRHDGGISGYHWSVERKRELLRRRGPSLNRIFDDFI